MTRTEIDFSDYLRRFDYDERLAMKIGLDELLERYAYGESMDQGGGTTCAKQVLTAFAMPQALETRLQIESVRAIIKCI